MKRLLLACFVLFGPAVSAAADDLVIVDSAHDVATTVERLVAAVEGAGATVFARVDHAAGAANAGMELPATTLVIFGNPKLGTPVMQADRRAGLDLPMRVLAWEEDGDVMLGYLSAEALKARYAIEGVDQVFDKIAGALKKLTTTAAAQ